MRKLLIAGMVFAAFSTYAKMDISSGDVVAGQWNSNFSQAKALAEQKKMPLLVFWASPGCGYCGLLEKACQTTTFLTWQAEKKILMVFCRGTAGDNGVCKEFVRNMTGLFPYVCVYWPKESGTIKERFSGRQTTMPVVRSTLVDGFIASVEMYLVGWSPDGTGNADNKEDGGLTDDASKDNSDDNMVVTAANPWKTQAYTATLPLCQVTSNNVTNIVGSIAFATTKRGKVSAKCIVADYSSQTISFSGTWGDQASDGSISMESTKNGGTIKANVSYNGELVVVLSGTKNYSTLTSGRIAMVNSGFSDFVGNYTIAFPCAETDIEPQVDSLGISHATFRVSATSRKSTAKVSIFYPDAKSATVTINLASDGTQAIVPIAKVSSTYVLAAAAKLYTKSQKPNFDAVHPFDDACGHVWHIKGSYISDYACAILGSYIRSGASKQELFGDKWLEVDFNTDYLGNFSGYGNFKSYKITATSFRLSTGVYRGAVNLNFDHKTTVSKYEIVALPGWTDVAGCGCAWYKDSVNGKIIMRGFPVELK